MGCRSDYWVFDPCTVYSLPMTCKAKEIIFTSRKVTKSAKRKRKNKKGRTQEVEEVRSRAGIGRRP